MLYTLGKKTKCPLVVALGTSGPMFFPIKPSYPPSFRHLQRLAEGVKNNCKKIIVVLL